MRERDLDEFGSLFQRSVIPTIEVERIEIRDVVVLLDFSDRAAGCVELGRALEKRFGCKVSSRFLLREEDRRFESDAQAILDRSGAAAPTIVGGDPATYIKRLTEEDKPSLIVAPAPLRAHEQSEAAAADGQFIDALLVATSIPTLLIREPVTDWPFRRILAKIPGGRHDLIEQFSFAFALCEPGGVIRLLHVVDEGQLNLLGEVLEVTPEIDTKGGSEDLLSAIESRMNHLLKGAVRTAKDAAFDVETAVRVGDPFAVVPEEAEGFNLLILGSQGAHERFLESRAYELMHRIPGIPVLAL